MAYDEMKVVAELNLSKANISRYLAEIKQHLGGMNATDWSIVNRVDTFLENFKAGQY